MDSTPSTDDVMAETGPIFSMLPASSSRTLEKILALSPVLALAVQRYSASPRRSSEQSMRNAAASAERMAAPASLTVRDGEAILPRKPEIVFANAAAPIKVTILSPAIAAIHPHSPFDSFSSVRFIKSIWLPPVLYVPVPPWTARYRNS